LNRLAIFDCDGTLVDSQHNICVAMERCFADAGLAPPPRVRSRGVVGLSLVEAMRAMLPEAEHDDHAELAESYKRAFQAMRTEGLADEPLYAGVAELIDALEAGGWLLGIATGKSDRGVQLCLEHHGLAGRFVTSYDMAMARAAGVTAVGVAWGYHDSAELRRAGAHHVAAHPRDILDYTKAMA
jgi:phosphoglycolate phosphatase